MELHHHPRVHEHALENNSAECNPREETRARLLWVVMISAVMMVAEIVGGVLSGSLALLSDGFHMFTHVGSILVSYVGLRLASRQASESQTFGYWRVEILTALFNGITLLPIVGYILYESIERFRSPREIHALATLAVGIAGLAVNLAGAAILHKKHDDDLNTRSAFLHLLGDTLSSVGVVLAAILILFTRWTWLDPLMSLVISLMILLWSGRLIRDCARILLESVPAGIRLQDVRDSILSLSSVQGIHDLHVWQITSGMTMLTCHVVLEEMPLSASQRLVEQIHEMLDHKFHISHSNIQIESRHATNAAPDRSSLSPQPAP